jgi:hypothetical protein
MAEVHPSPVLPTTPPPAPRSCHERPRGYAPPRAARPHGQSTFTATARPNVYVQRKTIRKKPRRFPHLTIAEEEWIENEEHGLLCALHHIKEMEDEDKRERHAHLQKAIRQIARQIRENA